MSEAIKRRLEALEAKAGAQAEGMTIIRTVHATGEPVNCARVHTPDGEQEWHRLDNETPDELVKRAAAEVKRTAHGAALLLCW